MAMKPYQIDTIIPKLSTIIALILTHKTTIIATTIATVIAAHLLRRMLKTLHVRRQFPTFTATEPSFCAVCLHGGDGGRRYRRLPQCRHCFHVDCIDTWLQVRSTCPLCRFEIPVHLLPRKQQKEPGFVYLFVYFAMKALRKRIRSNFSKMMIFDGDDL